MINRRRYDDDVKIGKYIGYMHNYIYSFKGYCQVTVINYLCCRENANNAILVAFFSLHVQRVIKFIVYICQVTEHNIYLMRKKTKQVYCTYRDELIKTLLS